MKERIKFVKTVIFGMVALAGCSLTALSLPVQGGDLLHSRTCRQNSEAAVEYIAGTADEETQNLFASLPETFVFSSGVGAWATELSIAEDGTFEGYFHDSNMGDTGDGYPGGSAYICSFSGRFSQPVQVNQYVYSMNMEELRAEGTEGDSYIENGIRYIYSTPYGLENGKDFFLYLPGTPISSVAQGFLAWAWLTDQESALPDGFYGLYNVQ